MTIPGSVNCPVNSNRRQNQRRKLVGLVGLLACLVCLPLRPLAESPAGAPGRTAQVIQIQGPIGPATAEYVGEAFETARARNAALVVLTTDTPGGLSDSMRVIIQRILEAPMPVVGFVAPSGSRAASAGTYILYACHVAAMAPGTNLGAATPIQVGGLPRPGGGEPPADTADKKEEGAAEGRADRNPMTAKMVNDAAAYIRSLAQMRGRNAEWAERSVREGASLAAAEALSKKVIDLMAADMDDLLRQLDGRRVTVGDQIVTLETRGLTAEVIAPGWRHRLLGVLTNPNIAFLLLLVGVYGLFFEFANPGTIGPGVVGAICLLVGFYALNLLPISYAGLGLLMLAIALMVAEALTPSFGVLGTGGIVAFVISATMLLESGIPGFSISWPVIAATAALSAGLMIFLLGYVWRAHRQPVTTGSEAWVGREAVVLEWTAASGGDGGSGHVRCGGERWKAEGPTDLSPRERVTVCGRSGLVLAVGRKHPNG